MLREQSEIVIEMAKALAELVQTIDPTWKKAYLRFYMDENLKSAKGSYENDSEVELLDTIDNSPFFTSMRKKGSKLLELFKKKRGLVLLIVDSNLDYEVKFEFKNFDRWKITKIDGGTGIPEGF